MLEDSKEQDFRSWKPAPGDDIHPQQVILHADLVNQKIIAIYLSIFVWACTWASAGDPAGIVLYMNTDNEVYLLLADHSGSSKRGWSAFGGGADENESPAETAARETEEETRGFFSRNTLLKELEGEKAVVDGKFHLFFHEVTFVPVPMIENHVLKRDGVLHKERGPYAWVPYSQLKKYLLSKESSGQCSIDRRFLPKESKNYWFWSTWVKNMRAAYSQNLIPWDKKEK